VATDSIRLDDDPQLDGDPQGRERERERERDASLSERGGRAVVRGDEERASFVGPQVRPGNLFQTK
jgi:hypothetical protein